MWATKPINILSSIAVLITFIRAKRSTEMELTDKVVADTYVPSLGVGASALDYKSYCYTTVGITVYDVLASDTNYDDLSPSLDT